MTMDELPMQTPRVNYSTGMLTLDSENTTLTEALSAIRDKTSLQIESLPESTERFSAHFSGTPREVIAQLLKGSEFGYILVASRDDPAKLDKLILTKLAPLTPSDPTKASATNAPRPVPSPRLASYIPPDVAERRGETIPDINAKPPSLDGPPRESTPILPVPIPGPVAPASDAQSIVTSRDVPILVPVPTPDPALAPSPAGDASRTQVNAAGQYMQELYRMRLQQSQPSGTSSATPPQ
jgi:hypothetical protein